MHETRNKIRIKETVQCLQVVVPLVSLHQPPHFLLDVAEGAVKLWNPFLVLWYLNHQRFIVRDNVARSHPQLDLDLLDALVASVSVPKTQ